MIGTRNDALVRTGFVCNDLLIGSVIFYSEANMYEHE